MNELMAGYKDIEPRLKPGESGNPKGKPKGAKNKRTIARETLSLTAIMPDRKFAEMKCISTSSSWRTLNEISLRKTE